jgi:hypothetical protein
VADLARAWPRTAAGAGSAEAAGVDGSALDGLRGRGSEAGHLLLPLLPAPPGRPSSLSLSPSLSLPPAGPHGGEAVHPRARAAREAGSSGTANPGGRIRRRHGPGGRIRRHGRPRARWADGPERRGRTAPSGGRTRRRRMGSPGFFFLVFYPINRGGQ